MFASSVSLACFAHPPDADSGDADSTTAGTATTGSSTATTASTTVGTGPDGSSSASDADGSSGDASSSDSGETDTTPCVLSGTWEVVLDDDGPSGVGAQGRGLLGTDAGTVISVGNADGHWLVRRTEDHGASWDVIDDFAPQSSDGGAVPGEPVRATDGTLFVVGLTGDTMLSHRVVRRSEDGTTWATVDDFHLEDAFATYGGNIAIANDGTIFTAGHADSSQGGRWIVRASEDGGDSWTTVDDFQHDPGLLCLPHDLVGAPDGAMIVFGHCFDAQMELFWVVRRSSGAGWTTVDDQSLMGARFTGHGSANGGFAGTRLYAIGTVIDAVGSTQHWTVRTSDDGITWSNFDDYVSPQGEARGISLYDDGAGTLIAIGSEAGAYPTVVTRRSDDDGASWQVIDTYTFDAGIYGGPLSASADGDLYTSGIGLAGDGGLNHWVVRRMACE